MSTTYRDGYVSLLDTVTFAPSGSQFGGTSAPDPYHSFFGVGSPTPVGGPFSVGGAVSLDLPFLGNVELFRARVFGSLTASFGLDITAAFDPGSIDATLPYKLGLSVPELDPVANQGDIVAIYFDGKSAFDANSGFTTSFPSLRFQMDLVAALDMVLAAELGVAGNNHTYLLADFAPSTRIPLISVDTARQTANGAADPVNVFGVTTEQLVDMVGLDPAYDDNGQFAGISIPLNSFVSSPVTKSQPKSDVETTGSKDPGSLGDLLDLTSVDLGSLAIYVPSINTVSKMVDGVFVTDPTRKVVDGQIVPDVDSHGVNLGEGNKTDLVALTLDVDGITTFATGGAFPPLEFALPVLQASIANVNFGVGFYYNLFDVELQAALPLVQEFTLTPDLRTKLSFFDLNPDGSKGAEKFVDVVQIEKQLLFDPTGVFHDAAVEARLRELAATNATYARDIDLFVDFADGIPGAFTGQTGSIGGQMVLSRDGGSTWEILQSDTVIARSAPLLGEDQDVALDLSGLSFGYRIIRGSGGGAQTEIIPIAFDPTDNLYREQVAEVVSPLQTTPFLPDVGALNLRYDGDTTYVEVETEAMPTVTNRTGLEFDLSLLLSGLQAAIGVSGSVDLGPFTVGAGFGVNFGPLFQEEFPLLNLDIVDLYNKSFSISDSHVSHFVLGGPPPPPDYGDAIVGTPGDDRFLGTLADDLIIGLGGADYLRGDAGDDTLQPGEGAATILGATGDDLLDFTDLEGIVAPFDVSEGLRAGDRVGLLFGAVTGLPAGFDPYALIRPDFSDYANSPQIIFAGVERIRLTDAEDQVVLDQGWDRLGPLAQIDTGGGNDFIRLTQRNITLLAGMGDDVIHYANSVPTPPSRTGAIDGGDGEDWLVIDGTPGNPLAWADLSAGLTADGMVLRGIENLRSASTAGGMLLIGDDDRNRIEEAAGLGGADTLIGLGGSDTLDGGSGNDLLIGGAGADSLVGGPGLDTASYAGAATSVFIDLDVAGVGRGYRGEAQGDVLAGIERVVGSAFEDILIGSNAAETLEGGDGNDRLAAQNGADALLGGGGDDLMARALLENAGSANVTGNKVFDGGDGLDIVAFDVNNAFLSGTVGGRGRYKTITENIFGDIIGTTDRDVTFGWVVTDTPYLSARLGEGGADGVASIIAPELRSQIWLTGVSGSGRFDYTHSGFLGIETGWGAGSAPVGETYSGFTRGAIIGRGIPLPLGIKTQNQYLDQYNGPDNIIRSSYSGHVISVDQVTSLRSSAVTLSTDVLRSVEGLIGTQNDDYMYGNSADNALFGNGGDDYIEGAAGNDRLGFGEGERLSNDFSFPQAPSFPGGGFLGPTGVATLLNQLKGLDPEATTASASPRVNIGEVKVGSSSTITDFGSFLWGGAGTDTLDLRFDRGLSFYPSIAPTARAVVDLDAAPTNTTISTVTGLRVVYGTADWLNYRDDSFQHATLFGIENVIGSAQADTIYGDAKDNVIEGMAGADVMDGRAGFDTVSYALAPGAVTLNLRLDGAGLAIDNTPVGRPGAGHATGDLATGFERFLGSDHDDTAILRVPTPGGYFGFLGGIFIDVDALVTPPGGGTPELTTLHLQYQVDYLTQSVSNIAVGAEIDLGAGNDSFASTGEADVLVWLGAGDDTAELGGIGTTLDAGAGDDVITIGGAVVGPLTGYTEAERTTRIEGGDGFDTVNLVGGNFTAVVLTATGARVLELGPPQITPTSVTPQEIIDYWGLTAQAVDNAPIDLLALPDVANFLANQMQACAIYDLTGIERLVIGDEEIRLDSRDPVVQADRILTIAEDARDPFALGAKAPASEVAAGALYRVVALPDGATLQRPDGSSLGVGDSFAASDLAALKVLPGQAYTASPESFTYALDGAPSGTPDRIVTLPPEPQIAGVALGITAPHDPLGGDLTITVTEMPTAGTLFFYTPDPDFLALGMIVPVEQDVGLGDTLTPEQLAGLHYRGPLNGSGDVGGFAYVADTGRGFRELAGTSGAETVDPGVDLATHDGRAEQRIAITVTPVNDAPDVATLLYPLSPGGTLDGQVVASDADGDAFTLALVDRPTHGSISFAEDGSFSYLQDGPIDFAGAGFVEDSFSVRATETGSGLVSAVTAQVIRIVNPASQAPIVFDVTRPDIFFDSEGNPIRLGGLGTNDEIVGHDGPDQLFGFGGDDVIQGLAGADTLQGGDGADTLFGDAGADSLLAGDGGGNALFGGTDADTLIGGDGADRLAGGSGDDHMEGRGGDDTYVVTDAGDVVLEQPGEGRDRVLVGFDYTLPDAVEDVLLTGAAPATASGNALDNWLTGNAAANLLDGGDGADTLDGGGGADTLIGGNGDDSYVFDPAATMLELPGGGIDTVRTTVSLTLASDFENLVLTGKAVIDGTGNGAANLIIGNAAQNMLAGGGGADTLLGGGGGDRLAGNGGADLMQGETGSDTYIVDNAGDVVIEQAGEGTDRVIAQIDYVLPDNVEGLLLAGNDPLQGSGNALDNHMNGNAADNVLFGLDGNDRLDGGAGADTMVGGAGDDLYFVDDAADLVVEQPGEGVDTVLARTSHTLAPEVENLVLLVGVADGGGNDGSNRLTGNAAANLLEGHGGEDTLVGRQGADTLLGGAGDDRLIGGTDADLLVGGAGRDTLIGESGADLFRFDGPGDGPDAIIDFVHGQDHILLSSAGFGPSLAAAGFVLNAATAATAQLIYDEASGDLSWDEDGTGAGAAVVIATLAHAPGLTASDIQIVA